MDKLPAAALTVVQSPPSTTGEQMTIDDYLDKAPTSYVICREGAHYFAPADPRTMRFRQRADGYDVWTTDCENCGAVYREEVWLIMERDGMVTRMDFISRTTRYYNLGEGQTPYLLPPGSGRIPKREFRQSRVSRAFVGKPVKRAGRRSGGGS